MFSAYAETEVYPEYRQEGVKVVVATVHFASMDDVITEHVPSRTPSRDLARLMRSSS